LELDQPSRASKDVDGTYLVKGDWSCEFRIVQGTRTVIEDLAIGSDALEAIVNAISRLRAQFSRSGLSACWNEYLGGSGLPAYLPQGFGVEFDRHLEELVKNEVATRARELEAKHSGSTDGSNEDDS
jgi:hypothetical protein